MNIMVRCLLLCRAVVNGREYGLFIGIALRSHRDASGASAPAPALAGKGAARARPRAHEARAEREEAHHGHQENCQGGTTCARPSHTPLPVLSLSSPWTFLLKRVRFLHAERMQGHGEGPRPHAPIRPEVLPDAHATAGGRIAHPDFTQ